MENLIASRFGLCTSLFPSRLPLSFSSMNMNFLISTAKANLRAQSQQNDPFFKAAFERAAARFKESQRSDPLFIDPYAGCLLPVKFDVLSEQRLLPYCLATKFIDDTLLSTLDKVDGLKQVVLFTDGMDTRPFRLNWPASTIIYDISPEEVFRSATEKLQDVGAKISRRCVFHHIPLNSSNLQHMLGSKGFNGTKPSIWAFQGLPVMNMESFKDILRVVSNLAMKGSLLLGELPIWLGETDFRCKSTTKRCLESLFMSCGFHVEVIEYNGLLKEENANIVFVADHLRFSDDQMEIWRRELQRIEEEGDEDGFEEL
ncbi:unnamed protein product [Cuscuta epithymum]|uniref:S-adenosyl-L-methionine-dependent methyltransferase n=1 Tax=Cuscuta epithymum TaxID=186058 RepID=A0AAV0FXX7_9ASTE|nr:unnamed protein product [Cuscuta epithymum]